MSSSARARAPGKLVLAGAYAVLEGGDALVVAVDRFAVARWETEAEATARRPSASPSAVLRAAFPTGPVPIVDTSSFSRAGQKLGLGSSAACTVAALRLAWPASSLDEIFARALEAHRLAQGGGSGIDVAASTYGGALAFRVGERPRTLGPSPVPLEVYFSGRSASTPDLLRALAGFRATDAARARVYARCMAEIAARSQDVLAAWTAQQGPALIDAWHHYAAALELLGRESDAGILPSDFAMLMQAARNDGCAFFPAGAGGGDVGVLAGVPGEPFIEAARRMGFSRVTISATPHGAALIEE
jgi:phosphomevalonate kinase